MGKKKRSLILLLAGLCLLLFLLELAGDVIGKSKKEPYGSGTQKEENQKNKEGKEEKQKNKEGKEEKQKNKEGKEGNQKNKEGKEENQKNKAGKEENESDSKNQDSSEKNTEHPSDSTTQPSPLKTALPQEAAYYNALPNDKKAWWFKRNKEHQPSGGGDSIDLEKYDAHFLGNTEDKVIYFTFDCGYDNGYTVKMLDVLKKHNAKASFFVTQTYIRDYPEIVKRMKEEGHVVGNHTVTHKSQPSLSTEQIEQELGTCSTYMKEATGYDMDPFFRPPMGEYSERTLQITKDMGYQTVFWSIAYLDYDVNNQPGSNYVEEHFRTYYHNGAISLMHNISSANYNALDGVLTFLEKEGYRFATVYELNAE